MSDYSSSHNYHSKIVEIDGTDYLIQGKVDDPLTMFRSIDELLECERGNVDKMLGGQNYD